MVISIHIVGIAVDVARPCEDCAAFSGSTFSYEQKAPLSLAAHILTSHVLCV